jgi:hypothetical protein
MINEPSVVQEYIGPLLFEADEGPWKEDKIAYPRHKWDWRVYVMIIYNIHGKPYRVYFSHFGLLRFCSDPYEPLENGIDPNRFAHVTNLAVSIHNPKLTHSPVKKWLDSLDAIYQKIARIQSFEPEANLNPKNSRVVNRIKSIALFVALSLKSPISKMLGKMGFANRPYFHVLGLDLMFDHKGNPYLLEVNDRPSMIRRPEDNHEMEKMAMIQEEFEIILGPKRDTDKTPSTTWEQLYPELPECLSSMKPFVELLGGACPVFEELLDTFPMPMQAEPTSAPA